MNPAAAVIRERADALKRQARDYRSEHCIDLWGEATASRMALGLHVASRELYRLAEDVEAGRRELPIHRTGAGYPLCATCAGGGCYDCTDPA